MDDQKEPNHLLPTTSLSTPDKETQGTRRLLKGQTRKSPRFTEDYEQVKSIAGKNPKPETFAAFIYFHRSEIDKLQAEIQEVKTYSSEIIQKCNSLDIDNAVLKTKLSGFRESRRIWAFVNLVCNLFTAIGVTILFFKDYFWIGIIIAVLALMLQFYGNFYSQYKDGD